MSAVVSAELLPHHLEQLHTGSGITDEVIRERGYRSVATAAELRDLGFGRTQLLTPGLLVPIWTPDGVNSLYALRPDLPRPNRKGGVIKYEWPRHMGLRLDVPPRCQVLLADPAVPLWITEGVKKGDALASHGRCAVALQGVWGFIGRNVFGAVTFLADWEYIGLKGRLVRVVFDSDVMTKTGVRQALDRLLEHLRRKGAHVDCVYLPRDTKGVDDYLLEHDARDLEALIETPRPAPKAATPTIRLLRTPPPTLARPLVLVDQHAYVASWLWTETVETEGLDKKGDVVRFVEPRTTVSTAMFVVRDDGQIFGPGARPLSELGLVVRLQHEPESRLTWRTEGVEAYLRGERPNARSVFDRLRQAYDHFMDFDRSLASQQDMCELSACWSLATWFAPAFSVLGYPWPTGEPGSGKSQWGAVWAETSYLGRVLTSSGTFAALRDEAEYGAALCFDDAEKFTDPKDKRTDPNILALMLATNRAGVTVPLKEPRADGRGWDTRYVNAYCPRAFTAIRKPWGALETRCVMVPLVKSGDEEKTKRDPNDHECWPFDLRTLRDGLWALALQLLPEAGDVWRQLQTESLGVMGRDFQRWRAVIAVARLMTRRGVPGLDTRMRQLMLRYEVSERHDIAEPVRSRSVVAAALAFTFPEFEASDGRTLLDASDTTYREGDTVRFTSSDIADLVKRDDDRAEWASPDAVGRILSNLRLGSPDREPTKKRARYRKALKLDVLRAAHSERLAGFDDCAITPADYLRVVSELSASVQPSVGATEPAWEVEA